MPAIKSIQSHSDDNISEPQETLIKKERPTAIGSRTRSNTGLVWKPDDVILSDYIVDSILGRGGMGDVYKVRRQSENSVFAVKTLSARSLDSIDRRRMLLREIRTWLDLPAHPNLAKCHFLRTVDEKLAIFSEYISGGTLKDWIITGKLRTIPVIIDVMIQFAWALHAAHCNGVIHQDVKPANILMTGAGIVKLTDFGLSSITCSPDVLTFFSAKSSSHLVTSGGMTPAYSSPEQLDKSKLSLKTDIWSYGISVLEIFSGEVNWLIGTAGPRTLEQLRKNPGAGNSVALPDAIVDTLQRCLKFDPEERCSMLEIVSDLKHLYRDITGEDYPRPDPEFPELPLRDSLDRQSLTGDMWQDPVIWLQKAMTKSGKTEGIKEKLPERQGSRRVQAIVDLEVYEMAEQVYHDLIESGHDELYGDLGGLYYQKSFVTEYLDDNITAKVLMDKMLEIYIAEYERDANQRTVSRLVNGYLRIGSHLHHVGNFQEALDCFNHCLALITTHMEQGHDWVNRSTRVMIYNNKAIIALEMRAFEAAADNCTSALEILEQMMDDSESSEKVQFNLGKTNIAQAGALSGMEDFTSALEFLDKGIEILEDLTRRTHHPQAERNILYAFINKSMILTNIKKESIAIDTLNQAEKIVDTMIQEEDRTEMRMWYSTINMKKGNLYHRLNAIPEALKYLDQSIELIEHLIDQEGKVELVRDLFFSYSEKAEILKNLGETARVIRLYDGIIAILDRFKDTYQQIDFIDEHANYIGKKALLNISLGKLDGMESEIRSAIPILEECQDKLPHYRETLEALLKALATHFE